MKDFSLIAGSSGSFPDVVAVDCSGPGEIDGFAIIADYLNDSGLGWIQALLNDQGITPNGSNEADGASQILDAIKLLAIIPTEIISLSAGECSSTAGAKSWDYILQVGSSYHTSRVNSVYIEFPINLPIGLTIDVDVSVYVNPGAVRTGTNRVNAGLYYREYGSNTDTLIGSIVYDDSDGGSGANPQTILVQNTSISVVNTRQYFIKIQAGNTGAASPDSLYRIKKEVTLS